MGFLDGISKAVSAVADSVADVAADAAKGAFQQALKDPLGTLANPSSLASVVVDAGLKELGIPAELRAMASFAMDPSKAAREALLGQAKETMPLIGKGGGTLKDVLTKVFGEAVKTPGGIGIAVGGPGNTQIAIGQGGIDIKTGNVNVNITGFDGTKDTSVTLPDGTKIDIKITPGKDGGKKCECDLPDGSKIAWNVVKEGAKSIIDALGVAAKTAGGLGGVLMGPFGGIGKLLEAVKNAKVDGQIDIGRPSGPRGGFGGADIDINFNIDNRTGGPGGAGGTTGGTDGVARSGGSSYQGMLDSIGGLSKEIEGLKKKLEDPNLTPEQRMQLNFELQEKMQERMQMITMLTNLMKTEHDGVTTIANNFRL